MTPEETSISRVEAAIDAIKNGRMVIMVDDESRENEGDLVFAANMVDAEKVNFMAKEARGLICLTLETSIVDKLKLPQMGDSHKAGTPMGTAFTVSIEAKEGVTTGISAADRARTIQVAIDKNTTPDDIVVPGHVFPLRAKPGGVLERAGHTEGSVDLVTLAGLDPAAVICEIMKDDGTMARRDDLELFSNKFEMPIVSIEDLITYRLFKDSLVKEVARSPFNTDRGDFTGVWFESKVDKKAHFVLVKGDNFEDKVVDVRVHKQRPIVDVFANSKNGGRSRIDFGLDMLAKSEAGVFVYLAADDANQAVLNCVQEIQKNPDPTSGKGETKAFDSRLYGIGAQILRLLGVRSMRVHVSSSRSMVGLGGFGLEVEDMIILESTN